MAVAMRRRGMALVATTLTSLVPLTAARVSVYAHSDS
jgi:hypothetical protein